jgi:hypothetical protein
MKKWIGISALMCLAPGFVAVAVAQEIPPPPKVLVIQREYLKPGKGGSIHERSESAFVRAMTAAKWPTNYFAADSLSGESRALFFSGYSSFEAFQKDSDAMAKNATLTAAIDRAEQADGELLTSYDQGIFVYREDMSLRPNADIPHSRYFEITRFKIKPGSGKDWDDLVKLYKEAFDKIPEASWAVFQSAYGTDNGGVFLVFTAMKSLSEVDQEFANQKKISDALGEEKMKRLLALEASSVAMEQTNLYQFNPKMSYPSEDWIKADPFWKQKPAAAAAPKPAQ